MVSQVNNSNATPAELRCLTEAVCAGEATIRQCDRLSSLLAADDEAALFYATYMRMHGQLLWRWRMAAEPAANDEGRGLGTSVPSAVASESSPVPFIVVDNTLPTPFSPLPSFLFSYTVAAIIFGVAGLCGWLYQVEHYTEFARSFGTQSSPTTIEQATPAVEKAVVVARITGMVDVEWDSGFRVQGSGVENPEIPKSPIRLGDKLVLASGLLQLTYDSGAKVILQGPCTYEVDSPAGGFLSLGKLTARVESGEWRVESGEKQVVSGQWSVAGKSNIQHPTSNISNPQSLIPNPSLPTTHSPLFTIHTPTATITDLGTEFGVEVDKEGGTTSHVFRGSVRLQVASVDGKAAGAAQVLHENESARVESAGDRPGAGARLVALSSSIAAAGFVREMPHPLIKTFDLVDVVAGGDGFSRRRNAGIDPNTGRVVSALLANPDAVPASDGRYHQVDELSLVDGVFIPSGQHQPVEVDSAGHTFDGWPETTGGTSQVLWAGGPDLSGSQFGARTKLGDVDYASRGHGFLFMHANKGITFDLEAIRQANPGYRPARFLATAGNTETASEQGESVSADFGVLVDGQVRFKRREISAWNGAAPILIPIAPGDRFLTLVATDGGNDIRFDWILFGDPRLELVPTVAAPPSHLRSQ